MKIYTRKGDEGKTSLLSGSRVPKHHLRIEAYGTVDELNAYIGLIRDQIRGEREQEELLEVQDRLFTIGAILASEPGKGSFKLPPMKEEDVERLERAIDRMERELPEMKAFILPGGHPTVSYCHIARCVCRRSERVVEELNEEEEVDPLILRYLNRASDQLFVLARKLGQDLGTEERRWEPKM
ncbi:MAG: cob(I)yrinic acid a,c-diamide adenosyltransferase [Flavobacteriales bacterium]